MANENNNVNEVMGNGEDTLTTEQKKKAINLQDLIYIKKYIDGREADINSKIASAKSEVKNDAETKYYKKTDTVTNSFNSQSLTDSSGAKKLDASSTDDNILPSQDSSNKPKINFGTQDRKFKEMWAESFRGTADKALSIKLGSSKLSEVNPNGYEGYITLENGWYTAEYYPNYNFVGHNTADADLAFSFTPFKFIATHNLPHANKEIYAIALGSYNNSIGIFYLHITSINPSTNLDGHNATVVLKFVNFNGETVSVSNNDGMIYFKQFGTER